MFRALLRPYSGTTGLEGKLWARRELEDEEEAETGEVVASWEAAGEDIVARRGRFLGRVLVLSSLHQLPPQAPPAPSTSRGVQAGPAASVGPEPGAVGAPDAESGAATTLLRLWTLSRPAGHSRLLSAFVHTLYVYTHTNTHMPLFFVAFPA